MSVEIPSRMLAAITMRNKPEIGGIEIGTVSVFVWRSPAVAAAYAGWNPAVRLSTERWMPARVRARMKRYAYEERRRAVSAASYVNCRVDVRRLLFGPSSTTSSSGCAKMPVLLCCSGLPIIYVHQRTFSP